MENLLFLGVPILKHIRVFTDDLPISLAAVDAPTIIDRFGAMKVIRDSTYSWICLL